MTQKTTLFIIISGLFIASCTTKRNKQAAADCPPKACTMEFRSVGVLFKDVKGDTLLVKDFSVRLKANNKELPSAGSERTTAEHPYYLVANDGDKSALRVEGDTLIIAAKHPSTDRVKTSEMVIAGGRCECHIHRVAGAEVIVFD